MPTNIADDNTPYKRLVEQVEGNVPSGLSGGQNIFIDATTHHVNRKDFNGTVVDIEAGALVDDTVYGSGWNGDTTHAPSRNAVYDKIETLGASSAWTQVVNETGASFTNFTNVSGTWASDGVKITQTDTAATARLARYTPMVATAGMLIECEVQPKTAGAGRRSGILVATPGVVTHSALLYLDEGNNTLVWEDAATSVQLTVSTTVNVDTWYKIRAYAVGSYISVWLDGVLMGTGLIVPNANASYIGLYSYQGATWFRNLKAWNLVFPA